MNALKVLNTKIAGNLNAILKSCNLFIYLLLLLMVNLFIINLPLIKDLNYEFSAINSLLVLLLAGHFYTVSIKKNIFSLWFFFRSALFFLLIPLSIIISGFCFHTLCSLIDALQFYLIITLPSVLISASLAVIISYDVKRFKYVLYLLVLCLIAVIPAVEIFYNPQIYFYSPLICFFPGNIYDESLVISSKMIIYRVLNCLYFGGAASLILFAPNINAKMRNIYYPLVIAVAALFMFFSDSFGFSTTDKSLKKDLGGYVSTEHFNIYFSKEITKSEVSYLKLLHEYYYSELKTFFKVENVTKIKSYIFFNGEEKRELFGAGNADMSKPWQNSIFVSLDSYQSTLKHEIAHCFSSAFATGLLKLPSGFNNVLLEGTAMAADPVYSYYSLEYMASLAFHNNYRINISSLLTISGFYRSNSSLSYVYAGAFIKHLIDKYGIEKFKKLYSDFNFEKYYNKNAAQLETEFIMELHKNYVSQKAEADYYYGRPSIFMKKCPRYVASKTEKAFQVFSEGNYAEAEKQMSLLLKINNNYPLIIGYAETLVKLKQPLKAINYLSNKVDQFRNTSYYYNIKLKLADLLACYNKTDNAKEIYYEILFAKPNIKLQMLSLLRLKLESLGLISRYLTSKEADRFNILCEINKRSYCYESFFSLIELANTLNVKYAYLKEIFNKEFKICDDMSGFACLRVLNCQIENLDLTSAKQNINLLLDYKNNSEISKAVENYESEVKWLNIHLTDR